MQAGRLILKNFDARIPKIEIEPNGSGSKIVVSSKMYDENDDKAIHAEIHFDEVAAIEFCVNYFDNGVGSEGAGLYEIADMDFVDSVVRRNFERRKEVYLLESDYAYNPSDPADLLNSFDLFGRYQKEKHTYRAFVQNVDAGVYVIIAKGVRILR